MVILNTEGKSLYKSSFCTQSNANDCNKQRHRSPPLGSAGWKITARVSKQARRAIARTFSPG